MSTVDAENNLYAALGLSREMEAKKSNELVLEDFMKLMVTELTHQDPFKPMDNTELATQISQFATVSGIDELNDSFGQLASSISSDQALQAANLVGRNVLIPSQFAYLPFGGSAEGVINLPEAATNITLRVTDSNGTLVKELPLGGHQAGEFAFSWDGTTDGGDYAVPGVYQLSVQATVNDQAIAPDTLISARVESVLVGKSGQGMTLNLQGLGGIAFNDVAQIH